jgi:hypothetical protein
MNKKEICDFIFDYIDKEDNKNGFIGYLAVTGKDQMIMDEEFDNEYDYRLNMEEYLNNSLTIVARIKETGVIIGKGTIYFCDYNIYKDVFFWKRTHDTYNSLAMQFCQHGYDNIKIRLSKKTLSAYKDIIGNICIVLGFTQVASSVRFSSDIFNQYKVTTFYLNLVKKLIHEWNLFVYLEPCGVCRVDPSLLGEEFLDISNNAIPNLGRVDPESTASFKLAQKVGMLLMEDLYHNSTLGPVLFSKIA